MYKVRALIIDEDNKILMVRQNSRNNKEVWTFPGGKSKYKNIFYLKYICKKKVKQKTGLKIKLDKIIFAEHTLFIFTGKIASGELHIDKDNEKNVDVLEVAWVDINDKRLNYKLHNKIIKAFKENKL